MLDLQKSRCWAEIDLDALAYNSRLLHECVPTGTRMMNILKADGYGHGAIPLARVLEALYPDDWIGVATLQEALELREAGIQQEILILGWTPVEAALLLAEHRITQALVSPAYTEALSAAAKQAGVRVRCHLKLDTGMSRIGYQSDESHFDATVPLAAEAYRNPHLQITGIFTHFSSSYAHEEADDAYTAMQFARFTAVCDALRAQGIDPGLRHCCNSASTVNSPEYALDMCRVGTVLYGLLPEAAMLKPIPFRPLMTWKARVALLKTVAPGTAISYNRHATATRETKLAVITAGDADGYFRQLTNLGQISIRGHICKVQGRVCMDMFMVDVTDYPDVQEGDEVILLGGGQVPCPWLYKPLSLGPSAVTCNVRPRVPRIYLPETV